MFCELKNFSFQKNGQKILNNIYVKIPYQKTTIILGKNGSGKTTLLKAINQLIQPTSGEIIAKNLSSKPMLFQKSVSFDKTAKYNQEIFFKTLKIKNPDLKWSDEFCTRNFFYKKMGDLSAGEQQKIFLARYFSVNPEPLMMDEPNQNLDNESEKSFQKLILEEKNNNKTMIMILHDLDLALSLGDYFIHLLDGKIEFCGLNSEYKNFLRSKLTI